MQTDIHAADFVAYEGPLPDSEEYRAAQAKFDGCLGEERG